MSAPPLTPLSPAATLQGTFQTAASTRGGRPSPEPSVHGECGDQANRNVFQLINK